MTAAPWVSEAAGRRRPRLTEPKQATWGRHCGRLSSVDLASILLEDAAVPRRVRFDPEALGGALRPIRMPEAHGHAGNVIVVGDTAQFGSCQALDLPRRLCDESVEGGRASWMLAVLGALHDRQPRFYEGGPRGTSKARRRPA